MRSRFRSLVRLAALVLLVWTGADLAIPGCCLSDAAASGVQSVSDGGALDAPSYSVDDCFCCARCLDTGCRVPDLGGVSHWTDFDEPVRRLAGRTTRLDHPPQDARPVH